jgi:acetolactate synthase-1/2/3 large subunit
MVEPITKETYQWMYPKSTMDVIGELINIAKTPRQGPVWLDIPLDIQSAEL